MPCVANDMRGMLLQAGGRADVVDAQEAAAGERHAPAALAVQHGHQQLAVTAARGAAAPTTAAAVARRDTRVRGYPAAFRRCPAQPRWTANGELPPATSPWPSGGPANPEADANKAPPPPGVPVPPPAVRRGLAEGMTG